jgi:hypothetical protein
MPEEPNSDTVNLSWRRTTLPAKIRRQIPKRIPPQPQHLSQTVHEKDDVGLIGILKTVLSFIAEASLLIHILDIRLPRKWDRSIQMIVLIINCHCEQFIVPMYSINNAELKLF